MRDTSGVNKMRDGIQNSEIKGNAAGHDYNDNRQKRITIIKPQISETKYKDPKTYRPNLRDREGDIVTGIGYLIKRYDEEKITIINLVDEEGFYMADHTQLDMKEKLFDYSIDLNKTRLVEFTGKVEKYKRGNSTKDYCIDLHHKPILLDGNWYNANNDLSFIDKGYNENKINKFLAEADTRELQDLIMKISNELNILTKFEFNNNFIFDYITNTFFLNRATYDLYEGKLRSVSCSNYALADLLYIISAVLFEFKTSTMIKLDWLLPKITYYCNVFQNVEKYNVEADDIRCINFKQYCKQHLNIETEAQLSNAWDTMLNRKRNFGKDPNPYNYNQNDIINDAFYIINMYIKP